MLFCLWKFSWSFLCLISNAFRSSPPPQGSSHLGVGRCVSTAGCMIRPGRLVILASSRERYDIYFSNPRPWGWKMHVSSLAKAVWVITYASVSSPMSRPYWLGVWQVMHDTSLLLPLLTRRSCTHRLFPNLTLSVCPSIDEHLSTSNLDLKSAHRVQPLSTSLLLQSLRSYFTLLLTFKAPSKSSPCRFLNVSSPSSIYKDRRRFVKCKDMCSILHPTQNVV